MNAYELADELDWMTEEKIVKWCNDVANMLRQQADDLKFWKDQYFHVHSVCATFEQQCKDQQDRIAELEKEADRLSNHADELRKIHADRIAELEKDLEGCEYFLNQEKQSEPVAWMNPTGLEYKQRALDFMYNDALYDKKLDWIPLYTTPHNASHVKQTKPLSDEEFKMNEELKWMAEEAECVKLCLDEEGVPTEDEGGVLSLWGRVCNRTKPLSDEADIEDYKMALDNVNRLTRELDVALNGDGAAQQASLCDIVCQVKSSKWKLVQTKPLDENYVFICKKCGDEIGIKYEPKPLSDEEIPFVGILQNADTVPLGSEIWKTDEEFIKYKKIILATVKAMEKRMGIEAKVREEK